MIRKKRYGGTVDLEKLMLLAVYHEAPEVITGDVATPIKYFNPGIKDAFKDIERIAAEKLLSYLPQDLQDAYGPLLIQDESTPEWRLMKAADRICAYLKCVEEESYGNNEFTSAKESILSSIKGLGVPETEDFLREFAPSFALPLDALN